MDESEVLDDTHPKPPRMRPGQETVARSGPDTDDLRERLRQPSAVRFEPIEEDVEDIALDAPASPPARRPEPPAPAPRRAAEPARANETPRPSPPVRMPSAPAAPARPAVAASAPVSIEVNPGTPTEAYVAIPVQLLVGGRLTEVQINIKLILDLKFPK